MHGGKTVGNIADPGLPWPRAARHIETTIQALANIEPITTARRPGADMISRTATTRLVADILDLLDRGWIAWANVLELLAYASGLKPVVRLVTDATSRKALTDFCRRQHWSWRWSGFWLEPVFHTPLNDTFTRLVYSHAPPNGDRVLFVATRWPPAAPRNWKVCLTRRRPASWPRSTVTRRAVLSPTPKCRAGSPGWRIPARQRPGRPGTGLARQ
jgi:hypothetical protein